MIGELFMIRDINDNNFETLDEGTISTILNIAQEIKENGYDHSNEESE